MLSPSCFPQRGRCISVEQHPLSSHPLFAIGFVPLKLMLGAIALWTLLLMGNARQPAWAYTDQMMMELALSANADAQKVVRQAEFLVQDTLDQRFSQEPTLSAVEVVMLGNQNGQVLPMFTTTVSREQWQANPQLELWTTYSSGFAALFYPPSPPQVVAVRPPQPSPPRSRPSQSSSRSRSQLPERSVVQIERAYDEGRLSRRQLNEYVDLLD